MRRAVRRQALDDCSLPGGSTNDNLHTKCPVYPIISCGTAIWRARVASLLP